MEHRVRVIEKRTKIQCDTKTIRDKKENKPEKIVTGTVN